MNYINNEIVIAFFRYGLYSKCRAQLRLRDKGASWIMAKASSQQHHVKTISTSSAKETEINASRDSNPLTPLNFKVSTEFHREFKTYAAQRGISMLELLQEGFRLVKERQGE